MTEFFKSFGTYYKEAEYGSLIFWTFPLCTLFFIWLLTTLGVKIFNRRKRLKTVFVINRAWIVSSMIVATVIIGIICYMWSMNLFANHHWQLSLLISLTIAMVVPVISLFKLRNYYTTENIKEITDQPKTAHQLNAVIVNTKKAFTANKLYFFIPFAGFLFLLFYLNKGTNLITLVYDNSESMQATTAVDALSETFDKLDKNNEIILTTIEGYQETDRPPVVKTTMKEIMLVSKSSNLKAGNVVLFSSPLEAKNGLSQISNHCYGSPVCESIWKTHLVIEETKVNQQYAKMLLIIITDGVDNLLGESLSTSPLFFDDERFSEKFQPENVFVIDYSQKGSNPFMQRFTNAGCDIYPAENNKQAYLDALDNALKSFKNNWYLVIWTVLIFAVFTISCIFIQPKKIA